ncbi:hypothetical protein [Bordetella petrii]|uniref:hypothetical protein n=1 Tax=Bordetella petrii TaxID=94624 RepID=UPI001E3F2991|nr:hypothetical protein [Bordetella petrii]MCD0505182.1 hypothetical protein [Bordetella petrii]
MKQTDKQPHQENSDDRRAREDDAMRRRDTDRTLNDRPADPNRAGAGVRIPPGVDAEDVRDPGRQTPQAPPVDNRSGQRK